MTVSTAASSLSWLGVVRLGLVQTALGAIVVLTTSAFNRVMVVELGLAAVLPGALVGWHYAVQLSRPRWGYGADMGGKRAPWIIGGMAVLGLGAVGAAAAVSLMESALVLAIAAAAVAYLFIGIGVGAAGTNLLALLAARTPPARKAAAAAIAWIMMIFGIVVTSLGAGALLDPFSATRLLAVSGGVCALALLVTIAAVAGLERGAIHGPVTAAPQAKPPFRKAFAEIWDEPQARRFTVFVFVSMLAYSAQDLILEPFAGLVHGYTVGESTKLTGVQNQGVLLGMIVTAVIASTIGKSRARFMRAWAAAGCVASAGALAALAAGALVGPAWPLKANVFALGAANGAFAVAAIGSMMALASAGRGRREGTRMGLWGASQAIAFGLGGFLGAAALDAARASLADTGAAFSIVFAAEGLTFLAAAVLALRVGGVAADEARLPLMPAPAE